MSNNKTDNTHNNMISTFNNMTDEQFDMAKKYYYDTYTRRKKLYFAGPWFSKRGGEYYTLVQEILLNNNCMFEEIYFPRNNQDRIPSKVYFSNMQNIENCDVLVALIDEKDTGTAMEIGYAKALGKEVILLGFNDDTFTSSKTNIMLAFSGEPMTLNQFIKYIRCEYYRCVKIIDSFEVLE